MATDILPFLFQLREGILLRQGYLEQECLDFGWQRLFNIAQCECLCPILVAPIHSRALSIMPYSCAEMVCRTASHFRWMPLRNRRWFHPSSKQLKQNSWLFGVVHANSLRAFVVPNHRIGGKHGIVHAETVSNAWLRSRILRSQT